MTEPVDPLLRRLAASLPDLPRWLEPRSMLLAGRAQVFGLREKDELSFVASDTDFRLAAVAGAPDARAVKEAVAVGNAVELICQFEAGPLVLRALPDWQGTSAALHRLGRGATLPAPPAEAVRLLDEGEIGRLEGLPPALQAELETAVRRSPVAAALADGVPVSFCYAQSVTESLWDVSIETLEQHRRRGFAGVCVSFMTDYMRKRGKEPVWGTEEPNEASRALAQKLGFVPVDRILVFEAG